MKIDGKEIADKVFEELEAKVKNLKEKNIIPHLSIILIGNDPASVAYVNQKEIKGERIGAKINIHKLVSSVTTKSVLSLLNDLNHLTFVHGIIVQQPLPPQINLNEITLVIDPKKDVDGFHPNSKFQSPIALAALKILEEVFSLARSHLARLQDESLQNWLKSKKIVVIGKGETGGKPIIITLKKLGIQPLIIDSKTKNPSSVTKNADIIISAAGKPNIVKPDMIKKGVILISIGLSRGKDGKLHGDYDEGKIKNIASFYTPTPGGVGPVNVAMLLKNLVKAAENQLDF